MCESGGQADKSSLLFSFSFFHSANACVHLRRPHSPVKITRCPPYAQPQVLILNFNNLQGWRVPESTLTLFCQQAARPAKPRLFCVGWWSLVLLRVADRSTSCCTLSTTTSHSVPLCMGPVFGVVGRLGIIRTLLTLGGRGGGLS